MYMIKLVTRNGSPVMGHEMNYHDAYTFATGMLSVMKRYPNPEGERMVVIVSPSGTEVDWFKVDWSEA